MNLDWAGGFFDGEGTVGLCRRRSAKQVSYWSVQISLAGTHEESVRGFASLMGTGKVYRRKRSPNHRTIFVWIASHRAAEQPLRLLMGRTFTKEAQVLLAYEARQIQNGRTTRSHSAEDAARLSEIARLIGKANGNNKGQPKRES